MTTHLRVARPVTDLARATEMYRSGLGLEIVGKFEDHDGFDGVMLGYESASYHLELTFCRTHPIQPTPTQDDLLVFYVPNEEDWSESCRKMSTAGFREVDSFNPYWSANGRTYEDLDGYRVVLQQSSWGNHTTSRMSALSEEDLAHLRSAFRIAEAASRSGNAPFGARLVGADGSVLLEGGNRVATTRDSTAHAEIIVIRQASATLDSELLRSSTLYTSAEPCAMCAGAICWLGIGRIVFGISAERIRELDAAVSAEPGVSGHTVLAQATHRPIVIGPSLEDEGATLLFHAP